MAERAGFGQMVPGPESLSFPARTFMANAVVLVVDRLGAGYLGPYGNTWIDTPSCNRLAAQATLFEWALADAVDLRTVYRSYWQGLHALSPARPLPGLPEASAAAGVHTVLVTDEPELGDFPGAEAFAERVIVTPATVERPAAEALDTQLAQLLAAAADLLDRLPEPFLLWIHARGMAGPWDGPLELRRQFADDDDPPAPDLVVPPVKRFETEADPDELLGYQHAYAGQIALLDLCLEAFLDAVQALPGWDRTLLALTSPRGYPLGEHGWIGASEDVVYEEQVHVPCLLRQPHGRHAGVRCQQLVQPPDLCASLWDSFQLGPAPEGRWGQSLLASADPVPPAARELAATATPTAQALRTPAWLFVQRADGRQELFAKPDDRWEVNEVANRGQEAVEQLSAAWNDFQRIAQSFQHGQLVMLSELLQHGLD